MSKIKQHTILQLLSYIKPYWFPLIFAFIALFISSASMMLIGKGLGDIADLISKGAQAPGGLKREFEQLLIYAIPVLAISAVSIFFRDYIMGIVGEKAGVDLRNDVFKNVVRLTPTFYDKSSYGEIQSRITNDVMSFQHVVATSIPSISQQIILLIGGGTFILLLSPWLSLTIALCIPVIFLPHIVFKNIIKKMAGQKQEALAQTGDFLGEHLRNLKIVQAFVYGSRCADKYSNKLQDLLRINIKNTLITAIISATTTFLTLSTLLIVLWYGAMQVFTGVLTTGQLIMFVFFANMVTQAAAQLVNYSLSLAAASGAAERLLELRDSTEHINQLIAEKRSDFSVTKGSIRFENLCFAYPSSPKRLIIKNLNLEIFPGETISIVGPSGAGKSTLFELLQKFYIPTEGSISIDDQNINTVSMDELMGWLSIVHQSSELFTGSIYDNLTLGAPGAPEGDVRKALAIAQASEFVNKLPEGIYSDLGQSGTRLSGGQKQRLCIARAIVKQPRILLLDEPTSAMDVEGEALIQRAFELSSKDRTTLIITHRLVTAIKADRILMMLDGKALAIGTHAELMKSCPEYASMVCLNFKGAIDDIDLYRAEDILQPAVKNTDAISVL